MLAGTDGLSQEAGRHSRHGLRVSLAGGNPQDKVLVLGWISTLGARALDVHVKLLFLTCREGQSPQISPPSFTLNTKQFLLKKQPSAALQKIGSLDFKPAFRHQV